MSPDIRAHLSRTKDEYGDDYTEPTSAEALSQVPRENCVVLRGRALGVVDAMHDTFLIAIGIAEGKGTPGGVFGTRTIVAWVKAPCKSMIRNIAICCGGGTAYRVIYSREA